MVELKKQYKVICRSTCEKYCNQNHSNTAIIISIKSTWDRVMPKLSCTKQNQVKAILSLSFNDTDMERDEKSCMKLKDGVKIAKFTNEWYDKVDMIIIHCDGGVSRSAGVAAAIMRVKEGDDSKIMHSSSKKPNMTCYLRTLKGFKYI